MSEHKKPGAGEIDETPGLAGEPRPTPPGGEDGTAAPRLAEPETAPPPSAAEQRDEGEAAERTAARRRARSRGRPRGYARRGGLGRPEATAPAAAVSVSRAARSARTTPARTGRRARACPTRRPGSRGRSARTPPGAGGARTPR